VLSGCCYASVLTQNCWLANETTEAELDSDKSAEVLSYEFDKDFPEITKHAAAYEAEIEKLIENMNMDIETVLLEYRDI
jgi:hypothetical protein